MDLPSESQGLSKNDQQKNLYPEKGVLIIQKRSDNFGPGSARSKKKWSQNEDNLLLEVVADQKGKKKWKEISNFFSNKSAIQCRSRWERIKPGIKRGRWTKDEDETLKELFKQYGDRWSFISKKMNHRTGKQVRERCKLISDKTFNNNKLNKEDILKIISLYNELGPNWVLIKNHFNNKYNSETLKNAFYALCRKKDKEGGLLIKSSSENERNPVVVSSSTGNTTKNIDNFSEENRNHNTKTAENIRNNPSLMINENPHPIQNEDGLASFDKKDSTVNINQINQINLYPFIFGTNANMNDFNSNFLIYNHFKRLYAMEQQRLNTINNINSYFQSTYLMNDWSNQIKNFLESMNLAYSLSFGRK